MIKNRNININEHMALFIKIIMILSCPFFTLIVSNRFCAKHTIIGCCFSFVFAILIFKNLKIDKKIIKTKLLIYTSIALYLIKNLLLYAGNSIIVGQVIIRTIVNINVPSKIIMDFFGILALPITIFFIKWFHENIFNKIIRFFKNLTRAENKYICITLIISFIISIFVVNSTIAFSRPNYYYDVIYTSDTGALVRNNTFINISFEENDIRQPLFGVFSLPIAVTAKAISEFCFFFRSGFEYETVMTIFQFLLLSISTILLARLLKINEEKKKYFYALFSCSFPYLLFSVLLEQYVIALFYLIVAIYYYFKNPNKINYLYVGAVGTLITSGVIFPLITKFKGFKQWINSVIKCFIVFFGILTISGQLPQIFTLSESFNRLFGGFAKKSVFVDKLYQYTAFIRGLFIPNHGYTTIIGSAPSYQILPFNSIDWIGVGILAVCIISFIINRKNKMALLILLWIVFSSIILLFIGWGTVENGLILYSLYFAWSFYSMIYILIDSVFKDKKKFKLVISSLILIMLITNICEFIKILIFAVNNY